MGLCGGPWHCFELCFMTLHCAGSISLPQVSWKMTSTCRDAVVTVLTVVLRCIFDGCREVGRSSTKPTAKDKRFPAPSRKKSRQLFLHPLAYSLISA